MAGAFSKHRFQVYNQNQHPYKHNLSEFAYASAGLPGVTNVEEAMDWLIATIYPLTQSAVALQADLPADGVITFSALGRLQGAPAAFSVGDLIYLTTAGTLPSCYAQNVTYKVLDKDGTGLILGQQNGTAIAYINDGVGVHTLHSIDNAFRVVFDDGDGKAAAYRWESREGDLSPSWYKVYDMDWSQDSILAQFQNVTQDLYAYKMGKDDLDGTGTPIAGVEGGQHIYGGATAGRNLTLHANAGDAPGVHSGAIRTDDPVHPTADNLFDLGTNLLRYKAAYLALSAQVSTMTLSTGLITDSTGLISFDNENLVTTGNMTATDVVGTNRVLAEADLELKAGSIKSASGAISFDNENLTTTGTMTAARYNLTNGGFIREIVANDLQFSATSGFIDFSGQTVRNLLNVITTNVDATTADLGDLSVAVKTISSTGRVILAPNAIDKFLQVIGGLLVAEDSTFSADLTVNVDLSVLGNTDLTGTLGVTGDTTLIDLFVNGDISTAGTFLNFLKYIVAPRLDATTVNTTTTNATTFKGTNLTDPSNNTVLIADVVAFPFTATTQDYVPHWDTTLSKYIAKAITYPGHAGLTGLTADDHTQYALLAGRTGGQVLAGAAAAAAGNLRLIGQAGAAGVNKIIVDDPVVPGTNANFTSSWQGYDLGSPTENLRHVYSKGEHFGLRFENVATLPAANVANIGRIVYNTGDSKAYVDIGGSWKTLGSGTGGGAVNLITDGNADDASASIFTPYADAAATRPVDGAGGSPTVSTSITSISPLTGIKSYLLTKPASNVQGQGWSLPATALDLSYRTKVLKVSVSYIVNSGTFVAGSNTTDSDIIWSFYDITNGKIVEPSNIKMFSNSATTSDKFEATVQFDYNCTSFRMIAHCATTSAVAYEIKVDDITVSPSVYVYGTPITDWISYVPTLTGFGTPGATSFWYRKNGQNIDIRGVFTSGTSTATEARVSLPAGYISGGSSLIPSSLHEVGTGARQNANGFSLPIFVEQSVGYVVFGIASGTAAGYIKQNGNAITNSGENVTIFASVPCTGLSSSVQISDSFDAREISARYYLTATQTINDATNTIIVWNGNSFDSSSMVNTSNGRITIPSSGRYRLTASFGVVNSISIVSGNRVALYYTINGGSLQKFGGIVFDGTVTETFQCQGYDILNVKAGDYVDIYAYLDFAAASYQIGSVNTNVTYFTIEKLQGPQSIAASDPLNLSYSNIAGTSIANSGDVVVPFITKDFDTHGAWITDTFYSSASQKISVSANILFTSSVYAAGNRIVASIYKNGAFHSYGYFNTISAASTSEQGSHINNIVSVVAGDTIQVRINNNRTAGATSLNTTTGVNRISILKVG